MKRHLWLALTSLFLLFACQPATSPVVTIVDNNRIVTLHTKEGTCLEPNIWTVHELGSV